MRARKMLMGTLQMIGGAVMLSFSAVFVKWAHVGPTMAGFYRMLFCRHSEDRWPLTRPQFRSTDPGFPNLIACEL